LEVIRGIRDKAEAARHYARSAALDLEFQNFATELKLRAERKAGQLPYWLAGHHISSGYPRWHNVKCGQALRR
jgi:hypothetical protein